MLEEVKGWLSKKWFFWTLFAFLFSYAIIRAWTVVPILDELATFFAYIQTGHYFSTIELVDANNHVLNSFFGHQFYRVFGDHFFLFRLASLFAFPIYFFSLKSIIKAALPKSVHLVVFLALVCIPWVFEYFSYSRGYGMAISFFFAAIASFIKWKSSQHWLYLVLILTCLWLTVASSLTYLLPSFIVFLYTILIFLLTKKIKKRDVLIVGSLFLGWIAALVPFVRYSFELKAAGALWWGNQDGLWESTGKSLSRLVLFTDASWVFYLVLALMVFCVIAFFHGWIKAGFWNYLKETEAMIFVLFIGSITGIVVMRYLFDVNYPMDRVGMYLVPLFLFFLTLFLSKYRFSRSAIWILLFFPISFLWNLNTSTSIFSPEDRIPIYFSDHIKSNLSDDSALSAEYVSHMSYAYSCRNDEKVHIAFTAEQDEEHLGELHINWLGRYARKGYEIALQDPDSRTRLLEQQQIPTKVLIVDTLIGKLNFNGMYFTILKRSIDSAARSKPIQVEISGKMDFDEPTTAFNLVQSIERADGANTMSSPNFSWYFSDRKAVNFTFTDRILQLKPDDHQFNVFLFNGELRNIKIKFIRVRIYQIDG